MDGDKLKEVEIRAPLASESDALEQVLDSAFRDNPFAHLFWGGRPVAGRIRLMNRWMVDARGVHTLVAVRGGVVLGVLKYADYPQCDPRGLDGLRFLRDCILAWRWRSIFNLLVMTLGEYHPKWHHRHLLVVGVLSEASGKGIGTRLMEHYIQRADADEVVSVLETDTERAKNLYERFGFAVYKKTNFKKLPFWYMKRDFSQLGE